MKLCFALQLINDECESSSLYLTKNIKLKITLKNQCVHKGRLIDIIESNDLTISCTPSPYIINTTAYDPNHLTLLSTECDNNAKYNKYNTIDLSKSDTDCMFDKCLDKYYLVLDISKEYESKIIKIQIQDIENIEEL